MPFGPGTLEWQVFPWTLIRTPGLPVDDVARMADPAAMVLADAAIRQEAVRREARRFGELLHPAARKAAKAAGALADLAHIERVRTKVERGAPLSPAQRAAWERHGDAGFPGDWQAALDEAASTDSAAERAWQSATAAARAHLLARCARPDVAHAIFLSSREFHENGYRRHVLPAEAGSGPGADGSRTRRALMTTARYLRRLTTRCELTSFFGPVHFAGIDPAVPEPVRIGEPAQDRALVEPSAWLLGELARRVARGVPLPDRRPRRSPLYSAGDGDLVRCLDGARLAPSADALALWQALDGERTVAEACARAGLSLDRAPALLKELGSALAPEEPPAHDLYAFERLLDREPADGPAHLVARHRESCEVLPWPDRKDAFEQAEHAVTELGLTARRHGGEHYADRYVFHEDRAHPLNARVTLGAPAAQGLGEALGHVLPLLMLHALTVREDARTAVRRVLGGRPMPLIDLLRADLPATGERTTALREDIRELVVARAADGVARLDDADVRKLADRHLPPLDPGDCLATVAGPDLMCLGDPGSAPWLVSELHDDGSYIGGRPTRLHPDGAAVRADLERRVCDWIDPARMAAVVSRRRNMFLIPEMPGLSIEISGRSLKPRTRTAPIADVLVEPDGGAVRVGGRRLHLYTGDIPAVAHRALALPAVNPLRLGTGPATPRITVGRTVLQRASWRWSGEQQPAGYAGWRAMQSLRTRLGLPRRVFVRHPSEPKPLYLDFADPYAVADIARLPPADITATEMLPEPEALWWRPDGAAQCAELRMCCLVRLAFDAAAS